MAERAGGSHRFTYEISTMGCKANLADSQSLEAEIRRRGGVPADSGAVPDLFLLNTCTVTDQADRDAARLLRRNQAGFTVATGCFAETDPERLAGASGPGPLRVLRNSAKAELGELLDQWLEGGLGQSPRIIQGNREAWHRTVFSGSRPAEDIPAAFSDSTRRTRSFLKIQDGCNSFCSYCIIPFARGRSRSRPVAEILAEICALEAGGVKEVALTAIHAADYSCEGSGFPALVERILRETGILRLRLTSLDPNEIGDELLGMMATEPRLCPHFHVSVQSASTAVLQAMKRAYTAADVERCLLQVSQAVPHAWVGLDLIAGFPGESAAQFEEAFGLLGRLPWTRAHVFPFSRRRGTHAARLVDSGLGVAEPEIHRRAAALRELSERRGREAFGARVGSVMEILLEERGRQLEGRRISLGYSRSFFPVAVPGEHPANELRRVRIVGAEGTKFLKGELL